MYPISEERLSWLEARIFLLGRMIQEIRLNSQRYQRSPNHGQVHPLVMQNMLAEQVQLNVERTCITEYLEGEKATKAAAEEQKKLN